MTTLIQKPCPACVAQGKPSSTRVPDYVRGERTEWCSRCDGYGSVNVPAHLWGNFEINTYARKGTAQ